MDSDAATEIISTILPFKSGNLTQIYVDQAYGFQSCIRALIKVFKSVERSQKNN